MDCRDSVQGARPLIIIGASARAATLSALRQGRRPLPIDLFADEDLRSDAPASQQIAAEHYPDGCLRLAQALPPAPFVFTGGLENHPALIADLERERPNEGTPARCLARVRDPWQVARALAAAGMSTPQLASDRASIASPEAWLEKPIKGCGGRQIRQVINSDSDSSNEAIDAAPPTAAERFYYQERVQGLPCAAVYDSQNGTAELLGVTEQLVGEPLLGARPFSYCGSIGPLELEDTTANAFRHLGQVLTSAFGLRGLFGVDAVLRDGKPVPIEVNPRYTASVEVLEIARDMARSSRGMLGKAILFAREPIEIRQDWLPQRLQTSHCRTSHRLGLADIPGVGTSIDSGDPVLTCFVWAGSSAACRASLLNYAEGLFDRLNSPETVRNDSMRTNAS